jgi:hypothetical protein
MISLTMMMQIILSILASLSWTKNLVKTRMIEPGSNASHPHLRVKVSLN